MNLDNPMTGLDLALQFGSSDPIGRINDLLRVGLQVGFNNPLLTGDQTLYLGEGDHRVITGSGNDRTHTGASTDYIDAGGGNNVLYLGEGVNVALTGSGDDDIYTGAAEDIIRAGDGKNRIYSGEGVNTILTGTGDDLVYTGAAGDVIYSGAGNDLIYAGEGNNFIAPGTGNDIIYAGSGSDRFELISGVGSATIHNFGTNDLIRLGNGLTASSLSFITQNGDTVIKSGDDVLATLKWVQLGTVPIDNSPAPIDLNALELQDTPPEDLAGSSIVNARDLILSASPIRYQGEITSAGPDYYQIGLLSAKRLNLKLSASSGTTIQLLDSAGRVLQNSDTKLDGILQAGTYYFKVEAASGNPVSYSFDLDAKLLPTNGTGVSSVSLAGDYKVYEQLIKEVKKDQAAGASIKGYQIDRIFNDRKTGLYAVGFKSLTGQPPVLVIRGTQGGDDWLDILSDANPNGIGHDQYLNNKESLKAWLSEISRDASKNPNLYYPDIIGESLGGAVSQSLAADYTREGGRLSQVFTTNSPGIDDQLAGQFISSNVGKVTHAVAYGDLISLGGKEFISGEYWLLDWNTDTKDVVQIFPYILDKHNQDNDDLIGNPGISSDTGLNTQNLSSSFFSYWTHEGVSKAARSDWALLNVELGVLSQGRIPALLSTRGTLESGRAELGTLLRELSTQQSDSVVADTILRSTRAVNTLGDAILDNIEEWNKDTWSAVANWSPTLWTALEVGGAPAMSFLAIGGAKAAQALANGGALAASTLIAGGAEAFEAFASGGVKAIDALLAGDGRAAWDALAVGGDKAWDALRNRGGQAWDALSQGGENAWKAISSAGEAAWNSLIDGSERSWELIKSGLAEIKFLVNGQEIRQAIDQLGDIVQELQVLPDGQQVIDFFKNGVNTARDLFGSTGKLFKKVEFLPDGGQVQQLFNAVGGLAEKIDFLPDGKQVQQIFDSAGKLLKQIDFLPTGQQVQQFFDGAGKLLKKVDFLLNGQQIVDLYENGVNAARYLYNSAGKIFQEIAFLADGGRAERFFDEAGNVIRQVGDGFKDFGDQVSSGVKDAGDWIGDVIRSPF